MNIVCIRIRSIKYFFVLMRQQMFKRICNFESLKTLKLQDY